MIIFFPGNKNLFIDIDMSVCVAIHLSYIIIVQQATIPLHIFFFFDWFFLGVIASCAKIIY